MNAKIKRHGFEPVVESPGGHTSINWRNYLTEFAPQLFRNGSKTDRSAR